MTSAIFILAGIAGWLVFLKARQKAALVTTWPVVKAMITEARVESRRKLRNTKSGARYRHMYFPLVRYRYEAGGTVYENDRIDPVGSASSNEAKAEETVRNYRPGSVHDLHYNPDRPQESYLECKNSPALFALIGSVFIVTGILLMFLE